MSKNESASDPIFLDLHILHCNSDSFLQESVNSVVADRGSHLQELDFVSMSRKHTTKFCTLGSFVIDTSNRFEGLSVLEDFEMNSDVLQHSLVECEVMERGSNEDKVVVMGYDDVTYPDEDIDTELKPCVLGLNRSSSGSDIG